MDLSRTLSPCVDRFGQAPYIGLKEGRYDLAVGGRYWRDVYGRCCARRGQRDAAFGKGAQHAGRSGPGLCKRLAHITRHGEIAAHDVNAVFHGTTVATNAILERKYSELGLIITAGYREALECARQTVPGEFGDITWWIKPPRVVPLERIREISARMDVRGTVTQELDRDEVAAIAEDFKARGIQAVAVSLLHSYRNPAHEEEIRRILHEVYPDCFISISSDILR